MRIMKTLITDRTQADASYSEKLYKKLWSDFTTNSSMLQTSILHLMPGVH